MSTPFLVPTWDDDDDEEPRRYVLPAHTLTPAEATEELERLAASHESKEVTHQKADAVLMAVLQNHAPEVVRAYQNVRVELGFWYS